MDADVYGETDHVYETLIVGSGFGGQSAAIELGKAGVHHVVILERRDFVGGTWCQNSYPGAAVDVQSHHDEMERTVWHSGGRTSWYQSASGKVIAMYPGFSFTYRRHTRRMDPADHVLAPAATSQAV